MPPISFRSPVRIPFGVPVRVLFRVLFRIPFRIPLTGTGVRVLSGSAALCAAGWALGYAEAVIVGGTGLLAVLCAVLWVLPGPRMTAQRSVTPGKLPRGDPAESVVRLVSHAWRSRHVTVEDRCDGRPIAVAVGRVRRGAAYTVRYAVPTARRGMVRVGPLVLVRSDPAGLARRTAVLASAVEVMVRPRVHPLPLLSSGRAHHIEGPDSHSAEDGSQTFHTLRGYVQGDDLRRVHWRTSARTGELMVRQMVDASLPHTAVVLDMRTSAYPGAEGAEAAELAVDVAASVACAALEHGFPLLVATDGGAVQLGEGQASRADRLLDLLATLPASDGSSLEKAFAELDRARTGGTLVVVTGLGTPLGAGALARLTARFERVLVVRTGPTGASVEERLPVEVRTLRIQDPRTLVTAWRHEASR